MRLYLDPEKEESTHRSRLLDLRGPYTLADIFSALILILLIAFKVMRDL